MKDYSDRIFASHGKSLGSVGIGDHTIGINGAGHKVFGMLDERRLTESRSPQEFLKKAAPVLGMVMSNFVPTDEMIRVSAKQAPGNELMDTILDSIRRDKENAKIFVLQIKPDEITQNKPKQVQAYNKLQTVSSMAQYSEDLKNFQEAFDETRQMSDILLKTSLPSTMWGGKEVGNILSNVKTDMDEISRDLDQFEILVENSVRGSEYIVSAMKSSLSKEGMKKIGLHKVTGKMTNNFYDIKGTMSRLAQTLHGLFNIDRTFKKHTGYPTTWFFDSSIFYDFMYGFENLINSLVRAIAIEKGIIEPLFVWKVQSTGETKCQTI